MNVYKIAAFGGAGFMAFALIIHANYGLFGLKVAFVALLVVALLFLGTTWDVLLTVFQIVFILIAGIGHMVGSIGDGGRDWVEDRKLRLRSGREYGHAPDWDDPDLVVADETDSASSFLEDDMNRSES